MESHKRRRAVICLPPDNPDAMTELIPLALEALAQQEEKDLGGSVDISQHILGLEPFALVRLTGAEEVGDDIDLKLAVEFGGGLDIGTGIELLKMAVEELEKQVG